MALSRSCFAVGRQRISPWTYVVVAYAAFHLFSSVTNGGVHWRYLSLIFERRFLAVQFDVSSPNPTVVATPICESFHTKNSCCAFSELC